MQSKQLGPRAVTAQPVLREHPPLEVVSTDIPCGSVCMLTCFLHPDWPAGAGGGSDHLLRCKNQRLSEDGVYEGSAADKAARSQSDKFDPILVQNEWGHFTMDIVQGRAPKKYRGCRPLGCPVPAPLPLSHPCTHDADEFFENATPGPLHLLFPLKEHHVAQFFRLICSRLVSRLCSDPVSSETSSRPHPPGVHSCLSSHLDFPSLKARRFFNLSPHPVNKPPDGILSSPQPL